MCGVCVYVLSYLILSFLICLLLPVLSHPRHVQGQPTGTEIRRLFILKASQIGLARLRADHLYLNPLAGLEGSRVKGKKKKHVTFEIFVRMFIVEVSMSCIHVCSILGCQSLKESESLDLP